MEVRATAANVVQLMGAAAASEEAAAIAGQGRSRRFAADDADGVRRIEGFGCLSRAVDDLAIVAMAEELGDRLPGNFDFDRAAAAGRSHRFGHGFRFRSRRPRPGVRRASLWTNEESHVAPARRRAHRWTALGRRRLTRPRELAKNNGEDAPQMTILLVLFLSLLSFSAVADESAQGPIQLAQAASCINSCKTDLSSCQQKCDQIYFGSSASNNDSTCKLNCNVTDRTCEANCH